MNRSQEINRGYQSLPVMPGLQRFDSGSPSETDQAPRWCRSLRTKEYECDKRNEIWESRRRSAPPRNQRPVIRPSLLDNSSSHHSVGMACSAPAAGESRRRSMDSIPSTPKRSSSFAEDRNAPETVHIPVPDGKLNPNRWSSSSSSAPSIRNYTTTIKKSTTSTSRRHHHLHSTSQHKEETLRLAEKIMLALTQAMNEAHQKQQQQQQPPKLEQGPRDIPEAIPCQECDLDIYPLSSCHYVQCPRCDAFNVVQLQAHPPAHESVGRDAPVKFGIGLTYSGLEKVLQQAGAGQQTHER